MHGRFADLKNSTSDLWEAIGNLISRAGALQAFLQASSGAVNFFAGLLPGVVKQSGELANKIAAVAVNLEKETEAIRKSSDALNERTAAIDRARRASEAERDAATELRLARVDAAEKAGSITPEKAEVQRAEIRARADQERLMNEQLRAMQLQKELSTARAEGQAKLGAAEGEAARLQRDFEAGAMSLGYVPQVPSSCTASGRRWSG